MAAVPFVMERKVQYHGIWNTGLKVTDQFLQAIGRQFDTKPSRPTFVTLSAKAVTLQVLTPRGDRELHRDHIAFEALREVAVNAYNPRCLMLVYTNSKNRFSVIVCSCPDARESSSISQAYTQLKNYRLGNDGSRNWVLRKRDRDREPGQGDDSMSTRSRTVSGVMTESFAFLNSEEEDSLDGDLEGGVFGGTGDVIPTPSWDGHSHRHDVGLQVDLEDTSFQEGSVSSRSSIQSVKAEVNLIKTFPWETPASVVGQTEFYKAVSVVGHAGKGGGRASQHPDTSDTDEDNGNTKKTHVTKMVPTKDTGTAAYRSLSTQTESLGLSRRYKKRVGSQTHSSNAYREMAAQRKGSNINDSPLEGSTHDSPSGGFHGSFQGSLRPFTDPMADTDHGTYSSSSRGNFLRAKQAPPSPAAVSQRARFTSRPLQTSSSSVSRPIEDVYRSWSRGNRSEAPPRGRRVIVHTKPRM